MSPLLYTIVIVSAVVGIPAVVVVLGSALLRHRDGVAVKVAMRILLILGVFFVLGGVTIPLVISKAPPVRDEALLRIAPQFQDPEFNLAYTSAFSSNADLKVEYQPSERNAESVCLTLSHLREGQGISHFGGWMIILWAEFLYKFFSDLGYPEAGRSLSQYHVLSFQAKGEGGGEVFQVAIKDNSEDHHEDRDFITLPSGSADWQTIELDLKSRFPAVDFNKIETISFSIDREQSVCIKNISFK